MSASVPKRRDVHVVLAQVLSWPDLAKFEVFEALLDDLGESVDPDDPVVRLARERREALDVIAMTAEFLGLPAGEAPTGKQFDQAARDIAPDWSSGKVIRAWERWRLAVQAFKGEREVRSRARRQARSQLARGGRRSRVDYLNGVRKWLQSKPGTEAAKSYDAYAERFNAKLAEQKPAADDGLSREQMPLVSASAVRRNLALPDWPFVVRVAKRDLTLKAAQEQAFAERVPSPSEHRIIGLAAIARLMKRPDSAIRELAESDQNFPRPVAFIQGHRAWLYEDVLLYKKGLAAPERDEGELQALFADAEELRAKVSLMPTAFDSALARQRWGRIPRPEGALVAGLYYWKRAQIEHWRKARSKTKKKAETTKKAKITKDQLKDMDPDEIKALGRALAMAASLRAGIRN